MRKATTKILKQLAYLEAVQATEQLGKVVRVTKRSWRELKQRYQSLPRNERHDFKRQVAALTAGRRRLEIDREQAKTGVA